MEIGSVQEIRRLEGILLPDPESWYTSRTIFKTKENGEWKEKVIDEERVNFNWLEGIVQQLEDLLRGEGVKVYRLYFGEEERDGDFSIKCEPRFFSFCLRDFGIFTKKYFIQGEPNIDLYGDVAKRFGERIRRMNVEVKSTKFEGGCFISNGEVGLITVRSNLSEFKELREEGGELYEFPSLNAHIDNFISFPDENTFLFNRALMEKAENNPEFFSCNFYTLIRIKDLLEKKGYNSIEINERGRETENIVANILNLGEGKIVMTDPYNLVRKKVEGEGIDVIDLYDKSLFRLAHYTAGLRCITLPIKRRY